MFCANCNSKRPAPGARPTAASRIRRALLWVAPAAFIALTPKCPACVVAYVALLTGIGLSWEAAGALRALLLTSSVVLLILLATWRALKLIRRPRPTSSSSDLPASVN